MTAPTALWEALVGWYELVRGRTPPETRFSFSRDGLATALIWFALAVAASLWVQSAVYGFPSMGALLVGLVVNAMPMAGLLLAVQATAVALGPEGGALRLAVPAVYAATFAFILDLPVSIAAGELFANLKYGLLGFMFFRAARRLWHLNLGLSIAFAALSIVALAASYSALYMLLVPLPPA